MAQPWIRRPRRVQLCGIHLQILAKLKTQGGQQHRTTGQVFLTSGLQFCSSWLILLVLSSMFVHLVQPGSNLAPTWSIFAPTWSNLAPTWPNLVPSWPNLAPTWPAKSSQNPPKLVPESIKKAIKLPTNLWLDFSSALDTFFPKLASKLEGRGTQNH